MTLIRYPLSNHFRCKTLRLKLYTGLLFGMAAAPLLNAQATPTASRLVKFNFQVGIAGTQVQTDHDPSTDRGLVVYGDIDISKHLGVEALFRDATIVSPSDFGINNYLIGPRASFRRGRFKPYVKALFGYAFINYQTGHYPADSSERHRMYALGGGIDLIATPHINVRLFDYERQSWPGFQPHGLTPNSESIGAAYTF
jgi:hypothetical protein